MLLHSHNDYLQARPLFEALDQRFDSVEADVFLVEGKLWIGHDRKELVKTRLFESMYLKPLAERPEPLWVLVDIKADGTLAYAKFKKEVARYPALRDRVKFVISGDRPRDLMKLDAGKYAGFDGRWGDLGKGETAQFMPWISESWTSHFKWRGQGPFEEMQKLKKMVADVHAEQRLLRFWAAPDTQAGWKVLREAGVDIIVTDQPKTLREWVDNLQWLQ